MDPIEVVRRKYEALVARGGLSERTRRLWAGAEADAMGRGGIAGVARATGLSLGTVSRGKAELRKPAVASELVRERRRGAGRPRLEKKQPLLLAKLDELVSPDTRGDPESPLRWTIKSLRVLAQELRKAGFKVSPQKVALLLHEAGYSLQGTSRVKEGTQHPDRNAQFEHINARTSAFLESGLPVISVDTKKKEQVGDFGRPGREFQPKGKPVKVKTYDFFEKGGRKAAPYGVYEVGTNTGFVNVGTDNDTPRFAVRSIEKWWESTGQQRFPSATRLYITADSGGSNSAVSRVWKARLQDFADRTGLTIEVSHFPPGTSKWNKVEHRLFSFVTLNWRGRPLSSYETIVALIRATKTAKGLTVHAVLDQDLYPLGEAVSPHQMAQLALTRDAFRGQWNYRLEPRTPEQIAQAALPPPRPPRRAPASERWAPVISAQIASGLNCAQYCAQHGVNYEAFIWARRQIKGVLSLNMSKARKRWLAKIARERANTQ